MAYKNLELELENLLTEVVEAGASDLHLVPGYHPILRIDSQLVPLDKRDILSMDYVERLLAIMISEERWHILQTKRSTDFSYAFKDQHRFRVNGYYQKGNLAVAMRYIPRYIRGFDELSLPPEIQKFAERKQGLVLVVGPTGHGKSTTLAAMINHINKSRAEHIITIEDPIEYIFSPVKSMIQQREIGSDTPSFEDAIPATLREDANVVMVGEMRDPASIASTITVAETGHLVFATLHTNDAAQTIDRIIDTFPAHQQSQIKAQLASTLVGVISMRLLRKIGGGRIPALEILIANDAARNLIRESKSYELINVIHTGAQEGMISLDQYLAQLVNKNLVSSEEAKPFIQYESIYAGRIGKGVR